MEPIPIDIASIYQRVMTELRAAELEVARLQGKRELLDEMLRPPIVTEGEDAPSE
jgi:hypothetical protein